MFIGIDDHDLTGYMHYEGYHQNGIEIENIATSKPRKSRVKKSKTSPPPPSRSKWNGTPSKSVAPNTRVESYYEDIRSSPQNTAEFIWGSALFFISLTMAYIFHRIYDHFFLK